MRESATASFSHALACVSTALLAAFAAPAGAVVVITTPYMNLENRNINSLGFASGQFLRFGTNSVVPNGGAGTTGAAIKDSNGTTFTINFAPGPAIPNFFQRLVTDSPNLRGDWTLRFTNGADVATAAVSLAATAQQAPFVNSITLSGSSAAPTFTWTPPPAATVNGYRINIYDKSLISPTNNGQVTSRNILPDQTSYTVTPADFTVPGYAFTLGKNYSIEISLIQTKDGSSNNLANDNLKAIARSYADFTPNASGGPVLNLPVVLPNGAYQYNMTVLPGQIYYIDPDVAVGYDYITGAGNPNFGSLDLPETIGDGLFDIYSFDAAGQPVLLAKDWNGANVFSFAAGGVNHFRVLGIEIGANVNPSSTTAFVTGVSFLGSGQFTGLQTPITVSVPEPGALILMTAGLIGLGWRQRVRSA
jgi:PEP-CTERM motif